MIRILVAALLFVTQFTSLAVAQSFDSAARVAMVVDQGTGAVLLAKNADAPVPPASMSKLMTLNMLFEALREGRVSMETEFLVSEKAHQIGGSTMFLRVGERVSVGNLIQGIIVQSGNDLARFTLGEGGRSASRFWQFVSAAPALKKEHYKNDPSCRDGIRFICLWQGLELSGPDSNVLWNCYG